MAVLAYIYLYVFTRCFAIRPMFTSQPMRTKRKKQNYSNNTHECTYVYMNIYMRVCRMNIEDSLDIPGLKV